MGGDIFSPFMKTTTKHFHLLLSGSLFCILFVNMTAMTLSGCKGRGTRNMQPDSMRMALIDTLQERGTNSRNHGDFKVAIMLHDSCFKLSAQEHDTIRMIVSLNNQGTNFRRLGAMREASDHHYHALKLCDAFSDTTSFQARKNVAKSLNGLGNVFLQMRNNDAAEAIFRRAFLVESALKSHTGRAINLANIGAIKENKGENDSAYIYYSRSMHENLLDSNAVGISLCHSYLGGKVGAD